MGVVVVCRLFFFAFKLRFVSGRRLAATVNGDEDLHGVDHGYGYGDQDGGGGGGGGDDDDGGDDEDDDDHDDQERDGGGGCDD